MTETSFSNKQLAIINRRLFGLLFAVLTVCSAYAVDLPEGAVDLTDHSSLPVIEVPPTPPRAETIVLEAGWRFACGEDAEILVGRIHNAASGIDGRLLLLDRQLAQVIVLDRGGEILRTCGRDGEGPGETNSAQDIVELSNGSVAILEGTDPGGFSFGGRGRIQVWNTDGNPVATWWPASQMDSGVFSSGRGLCVSGDGIMISYQMMHVSPPEFIFVSRLVLLDEDGRATALFGDYRAVSNFGNMKSHELDYYEPYSVPRFDMAEDGTKAYLPERDRYLVIVRRVDGSGMRLESDVEAPRRTKAEKAAFIGRYGSGPDSIVPCDTKPVLAAVRFRPDGRLWVERTPTQPYGPGIFGRYDEFSPDGDLLREVVLTAPGDPATDKLCFLADGRFVLIRDHHVDEDGHDEAEDAESFLEPEVVLLTLP